MSTYKSYLISTSYPDSHPRYDKEAPEEIKKIAEEFVRSIQSPEDEYDRDTFVLRRRTVIVNTHMAEISERELQNPHIRFFNERNPGWREVSGAFCRQGSEYKFVVLLPGRPASDNGKGDVENTTDTWFESDSAKILQTVTGKYIVIPFFFCYLYHLFNDESLFYCPSFSLPSLFTSQVISPEET